MNTTPAVSVIMSVRNGGTDLPKAVATILDQTFSNFELIAINNGSTDETAAFLDGLDDPRVRIYHQADEGFARALNRGISLARGRYIARQDHDDWALSSRIEKQVKFLDAHPEVALVGTRAEIWIGDTKTGRVHDHPTDDKVIRFELLFNNPFVHSSVMIRKAALDQVGVYTVDPARQPPEDYELWSRIARKFQVANLPERLTIYREVPGSMSRTGADPFKKKLVLLSAENLAAALGFSKPEKVHFDIASLIHDFPGFSAKGTDLNRMCSVLAEAGRYIADGESKKIDEHVTRYQRQLKRQYLVKSYGLNRYQVFATRIWRTLFNFENNSEA